MRDFPPATVDPSAPPPVVDPAPALCVKAKREPAPPRSSRHQPKQARAVTTTDVSAAHPGGSGSGRHASSPHRIAYLIQSNDVAPLRIPRGPPSTTCRIRAPRTDHHLFGEGGRDVVADVPLARRARSPCGRCGPRDRRRSSSTTRTTNEALMKAILLEEDLAADRRVPGELPCSVLISRAKNEMLDPTFRVRSRHDPSLADPRPAGHPLQVTAAQVPRARLRLSPSRGSAAFRLGA